MRWTHLALALALATGGTARADEPDYDALMAEAAWDWDPGDLIFRDGISPADAVVARALGLDWETVGILRASSGGPRVVFVDPAEGVTEVMLYEFTEGLGAADYAVYRLRGTGAADADTPIPAGPMVRLALSRAYGAPADPWLILGDGTFYGAELAYLAALNAGVALGAPVPLRDLAGPPDRMDAALRAMLQGHRYCQHELSFDACWADSLGAQGIVTTGSLIASGRLRRVYP